MIDHWPRCPVGRSKGGTRRASVLALLIAQMMSLTILGAWLSGADLAVEIDPIALRALEKMSDMVVAVKSDRPVTPQ